MTWLLPLAAFLAALASVAAMLIVSYSSRARRHLARGRAIAAEFDRLDSARQVIDLLISLRSKMDPGERMHIDAAVLRWLEQAALVQRAADRWRETKP